MHELAVTAIGADRPGIVATVARVLQDRDGNLEDSTMTILGGHFAIVLLVATRDEPETLADALRDATEEFGLTITVSHADAQRGAVNPTHLLSVYGTDHPGIVAGVTTALAELDANITDLETQVIHTDAEPIYAMMIEIEADAAEQLSRRVTAACEELGVDHTLRTIEAETY